jgi:hypothetical protein
MKEKYQEIVATLRDAMIWTGGSDKLLSMEKKWGRKWKKKMQGAETFKINQLIMMR